MKLDNATVLPTCASSWRPALEAGADEVLADEMTQQVKLDLSAQPGVYLQARD